VGSCELDSCGSRRGPVAGLCEHSDESSGSIKIAGSCLTSWVTMSFSKNILHRRISKISLPFLADIRSACPISTKINVNLVLQKPKENNSPQLCDWRSLNRQLLPWISLKMTRHTHTHTNSFPPAKLLKPFSVQVCVTETL